MLLTFAYAMVNYYDSSIPGLGFSIKGFIDGGTTNLVNLIGSDGSTTMLNEIHAASSKTGPSLLTSIMSPYYSIVYFVVQFLLALLAAIVSAILAYGAIAATIIGLLGPIFIPFLVFDKLDWLFWGWLKAYLGFSFYKVIAAATMNVLAHVLTNYYIQLGQSISDPSTMVQTLPLLTFSCWSTSTFCSRFRPCRTAYSAAVADTAAAWAWSQWRCGPRCKSR
jgi:type IV secretory pathway VirB6-like protein